LTQAVNFHTDEADTPYNAKDIENNKRANNVLLGFVGRRLASQPYQEKN